MDLDLLLKQKQKELQHLEMEAAKEVASLRRTLSDDRLTSLDRLSQIRTSSRLDNPVDMILTARDRLESQVSILETAIAAAKYVTKVS